MCVHICVCARVCVCLCVCVVCVCGVCVCVCVCVCECVLSYSGTVVAVLVDAHLSCPAVSQILIDTILSSTLAWTLLKSTPDTGGEGRVG